jgi:hypothetical protein
VVLPVSRGRLRAPIMGSALLHLAVVLIALLLRREAPAEKRAVESSALPKQVDMVYIAPKAGRRPSAPPRPRPETPQPPQPQRDTRPPSTVTREIDGAPGQAARPSELAAAAVPKPVRPTAKEQPAEAPSPEPEHARTSSEPTPAEGQEAIESEAQRIFGPKQRADAGSSALGPQLAGPSTGGVEGAAARASDCRPSAPTPRAPGEPPELATISGRIYRRGTQIPLRNASLQMLGTPYVAFTDDSGWYTFRFDADLVKECRTQMVRVSAPGYRTQTLAVMIAAHATQSDVMLDGR